MPPYQDKTMQLNWQWYQFEDFHRRELYAILALRQEVFIVEQRCAYLDCDGLDEAAWHLVGWKMPGEGYCPLAYVRVLPPGTKNPLPVIGRLLTHPAIRRQGIAAHLLTQAINKIQGLYPGLSIRISAQHYLLNFYLRFGFVPVSEPYDEDGIAHIAMVRSCRQPSQE